MRKDVHIQLKNRSAILIEGVIGKNLFAEDSTPGYTFSQFKRDFDFIEGVKRVELMTIGGTLYEAYPIYDTILNSKSETITDVVGNTASAGTIIHQAGNVRRIAKHAKYRIHNTQMSLEGDKDKLKEQAERIFDNLKEEDSKIADIYASKAKISKEEILKLMKEDRWLSAEETIQYGFADEIIPEKSNIINPKSEIMDKLLNKLNASDEAGAIKRLEAKEDEGKEMKKSNEDKDKEIENLKSEVEKLKKALEEKDEKEKENKINAIVNFAIGSGKVKGDSGNMLMNIGKSQGVEALQNFVNDLPQPKTADMIEGSPPFESRYKSKSEITNAWKSGKISTLEYQKELTNLKQ